MNISEKISDDIWNSDQFKSDLSKLMAVSILNDYEYIINSSIEILDESLVIRLLQSAVIFADTSNVIYRNTAQQICTALLKIKKSNDAIQALFLLTQSRLRNFPVLDSLNIDKSYSFLPFPLKCEFNKTKSEQSIDFCNGNILHLTQFQMNSWKLLHGNGSISLSAPTSSGKSYLLLLYLIEQFNKHSSLCAIYIVPTRALINQVTDDINRELIRLKCDNILISTSPIGIDTNNKKILYVLTQERLESLLLTKHDLSIDIIVIDESQMISNGYRGILLESVIDRVQDKSSRVKFVFSGPLISNPNFFSKLIKSHNLLPYSTLESTVTQNIIFLDYSYIPINEVKVKIKVGEDVNEIGSVKIDHKLISNIDILSKMSVLFGQSGSSIVYSAGRAEAEKIALRIAQEVPEHRVNKEDLYELIKFVKRHIHKDYALVGTLEKGVGFHYGSMPSLLRKNLEKYFKDKKISYLISTSTLLYGVNLPTKNIFLLKPTKGKHTPLSGHEFWNLAGRAGRLGKELEGNIFIINYQKWDNDIIHANQDISVDSALRKTIFDDANSFITFLDSPDISSIDNNKFEIAFGKLVLDYRTNNLNNTLLKYTSERKKSQLQDVIDKITIISDSLNLPTELINKNIEVSLFRQSELLNYFSNQLQIHPPTHFILPFPNDDFNKVRKYYLHAFQTIDKILLRRNNNLYKYYTMLAIKWMRGDKLPQIINSIIDYKRKSGGKISTARIIRDTMKDIEEHIRYTYVKSFSCYNSILEYTLKCYGFENYLEAIPDIPTFLEMGGSSGTMINMLVLGLSRTSAESLLDFMPHNNMSIDEITQWIRNTNLHQLDISILCLNEINELFNK